MSLPSQLFCVLRTASAYRLDYPYRFCYCCGAICVIRLLLPSHTSTGFSRAPAHNTVGTGPVCLFHENLTQDRTNVKRAVCSVSAPVTPRDVKVKIT